MLLVPGKRRKLAEFEDLAATAGPELVAGGQPGGRGRRRVPPDEAGLDD